MRSPDCSGSLRTVTRDLQQSEDLVQETVVRALERADSYRGDAALATWLHRILHNLAVDRARRDREIPVEDLAEAVEQRWRDDCVHRRRLGRGPARGDPGGA